MCISTEPLLFNNLSVLIRDSKKIPGEVKTVGDLCFQLTLLAGTRLRADAGPEGFAFLFLAQKDSGFGSIELERELHGTRSSSNCSPGSRSTGTPNGS